VISHDKISQLLKNLPVLNARNIHSLASFIFIEGHTGMAANIRNVSFLTVTLKQLCHLCRVNATKCDKVK